MKKRFLFFFLISGIVLMNGCLKEHSLESGNEPSEGSLQDDGAGDCLPKTVSGAYVIGTALGTSNYIDVEVNVTKLGTYTIYTDTVNGMYFRVSGIFTNLGLNTVRLKGNGSPVAIGLSNFLVSYGASGCSIAVTVTGSLAVFTLDGAPGACMNATTAGTYTAGTVLTAANTATIHVTVTTAGAYNIATTVSNGMIFTGSGTLAAGAQTIVLSAAGTTPTTSGTTNIPVTIGASSCSFPVTVNAAAGAATFTVKCTTAVVNGTYTVGTALSAATNTVTITVDVATAGTYSISGTINGMTFSTAAGASFAAAGAGQSVTLTGSGTPTTSGANVVPLTAGTAPCNFTVNVNAAAGGAVFTVKCPTAVPNGTYTVGTPLGAGNTITITVDVATAGTYAISGTVNGMTFSSAAGASFAAAGAGQIITLTGSGIPTTSGANTVPLTGGTAPCSFNVNVNPGAGGLAVFTVDCSTASLNGYLTKGVPVAPVNTITIDVNVATPGTYTITTTPLNGITYTATGTFAATGVTTVTMSGTGTPVNSGHFTINIPSGTTACGFDIDVDPNLGTWTFKVGATTYSGTIYDAAFDNTTLTPPAILFYLSGDDAAGNLFDIVLGDANGTLVNGEIYKGAPPITGNIAGVYYQGVNGTTYEGDPVDTTLTTNTMIVTLTTHNAATKTMTGTFSGKAILNGGATLVDITSGAFTLTYP